MQMTQPPVKHKTFTYRTSLEWVGNKSGILRSEGKPEFRVASPPEFKGESGVWTPEDLFVGSLNICTMNTFLAFSQRQELPIVSYASTAEGTLEFVEGAYQFTKVFIRPTIVVEAPGAVDKAQRTIQDIHRSCLIANSVRTSVVIEPKIEVRGQGS